MAKSVGNLEEVVEEIMRLHSSLPPQPSVEEVEAALFLIGNVDITKTTRLQILSRQVKPPDAPEELFAVMKEMRRIRIEMQAEEEKREALALLQLEDHHRFFDYLVQKASTAMPSSSSSPNYVLDAPLSVRNSAKIIANGATIMGNIADFAVKAEHMETQILDTKAEGGQKLSLVKLASLIEAIAKEGAEKLDLQGRLLDQVEWLPDSIGKLTNLTEISLSENRIVTLPSSIQGLSMLTKLDLHANKLMDIPDAIGELSNLTMLDVHGNSLQKLPVSIVSLSRLVCLDLSSNQILSLPESVGQLVNLKRLNIETNEIEELPYTIGQCASLTELRADFNHLKGLPEAVGKLEYLQILTLHYNNIKSLPTTMGSLSNLRELDVSFNELEYIPESLCLATSASLTELRADFNHLKGLPEAVGKLEYLQILTLHYNNIKSLPTTMGSLSNLRELDVSFNELEYIPESLCLATSLVKLNISRNFTDLQKLPWSIGNLEMLEELDISNDQIKILPDSFSMRTKLRTLYAEETPLDIPPREIAEIGAKAVVQFMIEHVAKRNENVIETKPKWTWSMFYSCLRKRKREESNAQYVKAGA